MIAEEYFMVTKCTAMQSNTHITAQVPLKRFILNGAEAFKVNLTIRVKFFFIFVQNSIHRTERSYVSVQQNVSTNKRIFTFRKKFRIIKIHPVF